MITSDFQNNQLLAKVLEKKDDYKRFSKQSISYRNLFDKNLNLLRPKKNANSWYEPFDPLAGANFTENVGFIEGNAWQYAFMVTHDTKGLIKLMGGEKSFANQLQKVFDMDQFDMANEPDIGYPFLFNYVKGEEWKTQQLVKELVLKHFKNTPDGLPGNDDTGTMSAWLVYSMMGIYPISPGEPFYTITTPMFDKITVELDQQYYKGKSLVITKKGNNSGKINKIELNGKPVKKYFINHSDLTKGAELKIVLE